MKIAVVGGGVMGLSCAWRLARGGARVELFESRACGQGATLAALGALWPASPLVDGPLQRMHRESLWQFEEFVGELSAEVGLPIGFRRLGRLEFLNSAKGVARAREEAAAASSHWPKVGEGPVMQYLDGEQVPAEQEGLSVAAHGALMCRVTAQVRVQQVVAALRAACQKAGVLVHESMRVMDVERDAGKVTAVRSADAVVPVDGVVVTAGAWLSQLSLEITTGARIRPVKGQGLALRPPDGVRLERIVKSGPIYLVPWDDEILVGSTTEAEAGFDEEPTLEVREALMAGAAAIFPALASAMILRHWAGLRPQNVAKGHPPVMGPHPTIYNLFLCAGHFKTGIGMAPLASRLVSQSILSGRLAPELVPFSPQ